MRNPTDKIIMPALEITRTFTGIVFDTVSVYGYGEEDELFINLLNAPVRYRWDMRFHIVKIEYFDFKGTISHSLLADAWNTCPAVDVFCQLALAARECDEQGVPYVFYIRDGDPHNTFTSWGAMKEHKPLESYLFKTYIYPRRKRSES